MPRGKADDRLNRLLAIVPWVASHEEGVAVEEVCERFGVSREQLIADLELLFLCGVHPFTPDTMIEVEIEDDRVWVQLTDWFARPVRLTPTEALTLVASSSALLATPGTDPEGPLARGLAKVAAALGLGDAEDLVDVELGEADAGVLAALREAISRARRVRIDHYSYGRDQRVVREVDPHAVYSQEGRWYLAGHCHHAGGERMFRLDRIRAAEVLDEPADPPPAPVVPGAVYVPGPDDPVIVLDLAPEAHWVAEAYPAERTHPRAGGVLRVWLRWSERPWLARLLLRLGPEATVVEGDASPAREAAERILARYGRR